MNHNVENTRCNLVNMSELYIGMSYKMLLVYLFSSALFSKFEVLYRFGFFFL